MNVAGVVRKILLSSALGCGAGAAVAQDASSASTEPVLLEEVVALNGEQLAARGMTRITDVSAFAPNVLATPAAAACGPAAQFYIRGVGQNDSPFAFEPGVGIYVDDVYNGILLASPREWAVSIKRQF